MRSGFGWFAAAAITVISGTVSDVRATVIYANLGPDAGPNPSNFGTSMLDDINLPAGTAPVTVRSMSLGFRNYGSSGQDVDVLVTLWDNMNTAATSSQNVNSTSLGTIRYHVGVVAGSATGTTGAFNLPTPISLADNSLGVQVQYVLTGTNTQSNISDRLVTTNPTTGTSSSRFWSDENPADGQFKGTNTGSGEEITGANLYLALDTSTVPEPASSGLIAAAMAALLKRRRCR
jgi:hypothetical protein